MSIEAGPLKMLEAIKRKKRVEELVDKFLEKRLSYKKLSIVRGVEEEKKR